MTWPVFAETEQHRDLRTAVQAALGSWRRFVVAFDGLDAAGKSNLARYLSWQLGMPAIETDLFLDSTMGGLSYRLAELNAVLQARISRDRPLIIEGVRVLQILRDLSVTHDYLVWVEQEGHEGSFALNSDLSAYQQEFRPQSCADFAFKRPPDDSSDSAV